MSFVNKVAVYSYTPKLDGDGNPFVRVEPTWRTPFFDSGFHAGYMCVATVGGGSDPTDLCPGEAYPYYDAHFSEGVLTAGTDHGPTEIEDSRRILQAGKIDNALGQAVLAWAHFAHVVPEYYNSQQLGLVEIFPSFYLFDYTNNVALTRPTFVRYDQFSQYFGGQIANNGWLNMPFTAPWPTSDVMIGLKYTWQGVIGRDGENLSAGPLGVGHGAYGYLLGAVVEIASY